MKHGFFKAAAITPHILVANPVYNKEQICKLIDEVTEAGAKLLVFPELCLTGYTCGDLFTQELLLQEAKEQLKLLAEYTRGKDALIFVGLPIERDGMLFNGAAVIQDGEVIAFVPKTYIPNYAEFYEARYFTQGNEEAVPFMFDKKYVPFGTNILFESDAVEGLVVGAEICEDIWAPNPPSTGHALAGAAIIVNLSASNETVGKDTYRNELIKSTSARLLAGYVYTSAGEGESTTDTVYGGHNIIAENGIVLAQSQRFKSEVIYADIDISRIRAERRRRNTFVGSGREKYITISVAMEKEETNLQRFFGSAPFVPSDKTAREKRCDDILNIQSLGLKKRYKHTGCKKAVIGISGGLDSTLALLVAVRTFDMLKLERRNIIAVTMPCFGTTDRTYDNACKLVQQLGAELKEINIEEAVLLHFKDIAQAPDVYDVTYENSQARERTQILMDIANQTGGLVVGTGDMSELALGFATYNGDHMSMYGVNAGVPKTLVRHLVQYYADTCNNEALKKVLFDVLDTPVSPELLPPENGVISQRTEDIVGPYEIHDFVLYYMLRFGYTPEKIYRIAQAAFDGKFTKETILKWMKVFYRRFFSQQFKRSCLPDGPKIGSVAVSPRGDLRMPSDASGAVWMEQLESLS